MRYFFINLVLSKIFILPDWFLRTFWPLKRQKIRNEYLDYQAAAFLKIIDIFGYKIDTENFSNIERSRANLSRLQIRISENTANKYSVKGHSLKHADNVSLREYVPKNILSDKAMLYFHGGGYVLGSVDTHHNFVSFMAIELGIRIYSLEYRLAPENKFPDALNDANDSNAKRINSILNATESDLRLLEIDPEMNAMLRTTCVATKLSGGHAENALPVSASATVNCRILPQSNPNDVFEKIKELAGNKVSVSAISDARLSPPSPISDEIIKLVSSSIHPSFPGLPLVPTMSTGATAAIEIRSNGIPVYGTSAMMTDPTGFRAHGLDERVEISAFNASLDFWYALMKQL